MSAVASKDARFALMSKYPGFEWQAGDWERGWGHGKSSYKV